MHLDVRFIASPLGVSDAPEVSNASNVASNLASSVSSSVSLSSSAVPGVSRIGVVVPRHQRSAVDRNRLKRRLRELVRLELLPVLCGRVVVDVAIRARREAYGASLDGLRADVLTIGSGLTK